MKRSLIICAAIFFIAALLGWRESRQLSSRREINARLVEEASTKLGGDAQSPNAMERRGLAAITKMLSDPKESWYVTSGALMALKLAPAKDIQVRYKFIQPWIKHSDWWMRDAAFLALSGLAKDDALYLKILPTLLTMATSEYHTMPREWMMNHLNSILQAKKPESKEGKLILAALRQNVSSTEVKSGYRSQEGAYNVVQAMKFCLQRDPSVALDLAEALVPRIDSIGNGDLMNIVGSPSRNPDGEPSLYSAIDKLNPQKREKLNRLLHDTYRSSFVKRYKSGDTVGDDGAVRPAMVNTLIDLKKLRDPDAGWKPLGKVKPSERIWRFKSLDATAENDKLKINGKEWHRFREIQLTDDLKDWFKPEYNDSKWSSGRAPIGKGIYKQGDASFANQSDWGEGEFIIMRTAFDVDSLDFDFYRLAILSPQGYKGYLNGQEIVGYGWWADRPSYGGWDFDSSKLKKGTNVIAAYGVMAYDPQTKQPLAQMDCMIEGLKLKDLE